jgi:hypothetical protein
LWLGRQPSYRRRGDLHNRQCILAATAALAANFSEGILRLGKKEVGERGY